MANQSDLPALNDLLSELCWVTKVSLLSLLESLDGILLSGLGSELHSENVVLHCLKDLCHVSHVHMDLFFEVVCTVHVFDDVTGDDHLVSP